MAFGTLTVADLLTITQQSVIDVGEDKTFNAIDAYLAAHNAILNDLMGTFIAPTTDRLVGDGAQDTMTMQELDEFGRADAQKTTAGVLYGFPLRQYGVAIQWTRKYFENHTPAELAAQITAATTADVVNVQKQIKTALFTPTNSTFTDKLVDRASIPVKALINADSGVIPIGPNGETFDSSTHTHYLARAGGSLAASDVSALILTVLEHYNAGQPMLFINQAQEAAIRAMTSNFTAYIDARIRPADTATVAMGSLNPTSVYNRAIGIFDGAEVWVKPWMPANYLFAWMSGQDAPLAMRTRRPGSGNFALDYENETYPLRARQMGREFGIGVRNRVNGAVLYGGNTSYTAPTL